MKTLISKINWRKVDKLVPAIIQDDKTKKVLMLGYMNKESIKKTLETGKVCFYSRTKKRLWTKGETSGNTLTPIKITTDCDNDTLLIKVIKKGPTCHKNTDSCFEEAFDELYAVIKSRKVELPEKSYTTYLFKKGLNKICSKINEESQEVIKAAKKESRKRLTEESVDLLYHLFVLLAEKDISIEQIENEILTRRKKDTTR